MPVTVIAEAGVNHNGSVAMALELVDAAAAAGADVVKFQTFTAEQGLSAKAPKAEYQTKTTGTAESQLEMVKKLELDHEAHRAIKAHCDKVGIEFLSTPFDPWNLDFLVRELNVSTIKMASGEIVNAPLLLAAARTGRTIILSTGASGIGDIESALAVLAFGYLHAGGEPSKPALQQAYCSDEGQKMLEQHVVLLHCTSEYPAPLEELNLRALQTLRETFGLRVGYSDHSRSLAVPAAAAALGAVVIEKHLTLDRNLPGPDHQASVDPDEMKALVRYVREVDTALGSPRKRLSRSELRNQPIIRRSLVAARPIQKGETFTEATIGMKRPGGGVSPMAYYDWIGRTAERDLDVDDMIGT